MWLDEMHPGLLQAILEEPDKDDLRLIYADWLEEQGQEARAEFVRYSIRVPHAAFAYLTQRDPFLLLGLEPGEPQVIHGWNGTQPAIEYRTWMWGEMDDLGCVIGDLGRGLHYRVDRGFVEAVSCRCQDWLKHGPELVRQQPIQRVRLSDKEPHQLGSHWLWLRDNETIGYWSHHRLPQALWRVIQPDPHRVTCGPYPSSEAADADLSNACLLWANEQARQSTPLPTTC